MPQFLLENDDGIIGRARDLAEIERCSRQMIYKRNYKKVEVVYFLMKNGKVLLQTNSRIKIGDYLHYGRTAIDEAINYNDGAIADYQIITAYRRL